MWGGADPSYRVGKRGEASTRGCRERPGPLFFQKNPDFVWGPIASLFPANAWGIMQRARPVPIRSRGPLAQQEALKTRT